MIPRENIESEILANWLRYKDYTFTHIANESWLPPRVAMLSAIKKKKMWLSPWVPDFLVILKKWSLLFIEMKRQRKVLKNWKLWASPSVVSEEQLKWQRELNKLNNIQCEICYWANEAIKQIETLEYK